MACTLTIGHRGVSSLAPENTLASFKKAVELGVDGLELDVQLSKDGIPVVIHDERLDRTTNGKGFVKDFPLAGLKALDAGGWFHTDFKNEKIPTLDEVLGDFQGSDLTINIEIKSGIILYPGIEKKVLEQIQSRKMEDNIVISSFNHYSLVTCRQINPDIRTGILFMAGLYEPWVYAASVGCYSAHPLFYSLTPEMLKGYREENIAVFAWTVNDPEVMKLLLQGGVHAIITDYPQELRRIQEGE